MVAYGGLVHPDEPDFSYHDSTEVRVEGYRRIFNQKASWRTGNGSAVLNIEEGDA